MLKIAVLGSGQVGQGLATGFATKGFQVQLGTRDPNSDANKELAAKLPAGLQLATFSDAAAFGDVIVLAPKGSAAEQVIQLAGAENFAGKTVIDVSNNTTFGEDGLRFVVGHTDSSGEMNQRLLPNSNLVRTLAFNSASLMVDPHDFYGGVKPDVWICGDSEEAKLQTKQLLNAIGWADENIIDSGPLTSSRVFEAMVVLLVSLQAKYRTTDAAIKLLRSTPPQPSTRLDGRRQPIPPSSVAGAPIAVLGTGDVGRTLATGFLSKGHPVMIGTRDPTSEKSKELYAINGLQVGTFNDAAAFGAIVVLVSAANAVEAVLASIDAASLEGKVLIDAINPINGMAGTMFTYSVGFSDSMGEQVQRQVPNAKVVKAFNVIGYGLMIDPHDFNGLYPDMFICGNDDDAKRQVTDLLGEVGWSPDSVIDFGAIKSSRFVEPVAQLWCQFMFQTKTREHAFKILRT